MSISSLGAIQSAHTAILVRNIKGGGRPPEKEPKEPKEGWWARFVRWFFDEDDSTYGEG